MISLDAKSNISNVYSTLMTLLLIETKKDFHRRVLDTSPHVYWATWRLTRYIWFVSSFCVYLCLVIVIQPCRASSTLARFVTAPKAKASQQSRQRWKDTESVLKVYWSSKESKTFLVCFPAGKSTTPAHRAWTWGTRQGEDIRHH